MRRAMRPASLVRHVFQDTRPATPWEAGGWRIPRAGTEVAQRAAYASRAMMSAEPTNRTLTAPEALGLESRVSFRRSASALLEELPEGTGRLVIDLSSTQQVDSAGLGALMMIQRKAAERRQAVCLRGANEDLRFLLVLTKLDDLFELEPAPT